MGADTAAPTTPHSNNKRPAVPAGEADWKDLHRRLIGKDLNDALVAGKELKDKMESIATDFPASIMLPAFSSILMTTTKPNPEASSVEHSLRNELLEIMARLPKNDLLRPYAASILETSMDVLAKDFEENALLASKIIFDLHKRFRSGDQVQPYFDFVQSIYRSLPTSVQRNFHFPIQKPPPPPPTAQSASQPIPKLPEVVSSQIVQPQDTSAKGSPKRVTSNLSVGTPVNLMQKQTLKSTSSFRVLTECPLTVMLLFQLYPKYLKANIPVFIQLMMEALAIRAPKVKIEPRDKRLFYTRSRELVAAQVKTLSFLTYLLRGFSDQLRPHEDRIANNVISLMTSCPLESVGTRKELLVATRHILATDFRRGFFKHIDSLLDERILMGSRHSDPMRPLGYSTLADLVHHVRSMLTMKQLSKVVYMFSRVLHDSSLRLPMTIQITAVRLLLNVVEIIYHNTSANPQVGRDLLHRILDTLVSKLATLKDGVDQTRRTVAGESQENIVLDLEERTYGNSREKATSKSTEQKNKKEVVHADDAMEIDPTDEGEKSTTESAPKTEEQYKVIPADTWMLEGAKDVESIQDLQVMIRSIVVGIKSVVVSITTYRLPKDKDDAGANVIRMTDSERDLVSQYIECAIPCMKIFTPWSSKRPETQSSLSQQQQRDLITYFAACFTVLDSFNLRRTLGRKVEILVKSAVEDPTMMVLHRHLLASNRRTSVEFCEILLEYLVDRIESLSVPTKSPGFVFFTKDPTSADYEDNEKKREVGKTALLELEAMSPKDIEDREKIASTHLELFERVIKSLASFPENEVVLRLFLQKIVSSSLRLSMEKGCNWPDNYTSLLRSLFRSISAGKFEESYKELLPMIPILLNGLYRIYQATEHEHLRQIIVELCLTVPARLSSLLPHMPLLLRMIIPSLQSKTGDLVNLGLRTLEFWIDNLNADFLYPILAKQTIVCTELMAALTSHLRPAPYQYGILALRVLGKLGGKNRRFLRDAVDLPVPQNDFLQELLSLDCKWSLDDPSIIRGLMSKLKIGDEEKNVEKPREGLFFIPLPIETAVQVLKTAAQIEMSDSNGMEEQQSDEEFNVTLQRLSTHEVERLWTDSADSIDLAAYCHDVIVETVSNQAKSAFCVLSTAISAVLDLAECPPDLSKIQRDEDHQMDSHVNKDPVLSKSSYSMTQKVNTLRSIVRGLMYALSVANLQEDALTCAKGLFLYCLSVLTSYGDHVVRIDANGSKYEKHGGATDDDEATEEALKSERERSAQSADRDAPTRPFGYFALSGPFEMADPFVVCEPLAEALCDTSQSVQLNAHAFFETTLRESMRLTNPSTSFVDVEAADTSHLAFYESILGALCKHVVSKPWNLVTGLRSAIVTMMKLLGREWACQYEVELIQVAIASVKTAGKEIPFAGVKAFQFFASVFVLLYGIPSSWESNMFVPDILAIDAIKDVDKDVSEGKDAKVSAHKEFPPSDIVLNLLIVELASAKQLMRFAARYALKCHVFENMKMKDKEKRLSSHMVTIKRVLFTRSLRLLPLPEQVAVVEALSTLVDFAPGILPVDDQHLLAFLSEFLKLSSIADGEMTDSIIVGFVVDKNGFTGKPSSRISSLGSNHVSGMCTRRECVARLCDQTYISIPEELPLGIQLRVSALRLLNTVIRRHSDGFFDADTSTSIGNIRPHVISLLFRSLVSEPPMSVCAAHEALQDVLLLSVVTKDETDGRSQSRLPKELLQTCIRPVLLNLRDYTRLSVPLLRGLARLLSLLSSWFNKTLGEKLLEHLQKWTEPERIVECKIWKVGEEPTVAASILDLFALLPSASHFVEPLVKTVIKLEDVLPRFKFKQESSPYRVPLARYLNKQSQYTVSFFFQRLKNPMYNELFQDIIALKESETLRNYLSGRQCSVTLLNVCFERPLAIIRSEKTSSTSKLPGKLAGTSASTSAAEVMAIHGIVVETGKQREALLRQDIDAKQKKVIQLQQEASKTKDFLQSRLNANSSTPDGNEALEEAKRRHRLAQAALEKGQKDLTQGKQRYATEIAHPENLDTSVSSVKKMTTDALELQHQGFKLVENLVEHNINYLTEHNDIVRAFRWLWRSKGRHLRLQHEELMPPRFHKESKLLGSLLVAYATTSRPKDVDVLFELLRIFLQPTTCDFGFIREFLAETVSKLPIDKKRHVIQRFFALLAGEGPEETKVLSIQLIVMPMLLNTLSHENCRIAKGLNTRQANSDKEDNFPERDSNVDAGNISKGEESTKVSDVAEKAAGGSDGGSGVVDDVLVDVALVSKFVKEVLLKDSLSGLYGDRVRVELLRLTTVMVRYVPNLMDHHKKDIFNFSLGLLKSEDILCKSWANLNVCTLVAAFDTPGNTILQTYVSLMRLHQHEAKGYVRAALSSLLPSLKRKLEEREFEKMIESTVRIIHEDSTNIPQLAHIWQTVTAHPSIFVAHRSYFVSHMVKSLESLGLTQNCPVENRDLSLLIIEILLEWHELPDLSGYGTDRINAQVYSPTKKLRNIEGQGVQAMLADETCRGSNLLDEGMINTIANFLVRMKILLADTKAEFGTEDLEDKTRVLLVSVLQKWQACSINPMHFEKVVSMCVEEITTSRSIADAPEKKTKDKNKTRKSSTSSKGSKSTTSKGNASHSSGVAGVEEAKAVSSKLLLACLDIFFVIVSVAPDNSFLTQNARVLKAILEPCFLRASQRDGKNLRQKLSRFLSLFLKLHLGTNSPHAGVTLRVKVLLESQILDSVHTDGGSCNSSGTQGGPFPFDDERIGGSCLALFSLEIIKEIHLVKPLFLESFVGAIVDLLEKLVVSHLQESTAGHAHSGATTLVGFSSSSSRHRQSPTSTCGILEEATIISKLKTDCGSMPKANDKSTPNWKQVSCIGTTLRCIVACLNLIASSNLPFCFTPKRKTFMNSVGSILDSSDNLQLLLTASGIVGNWLVSDDGSGPLAVKERVAFLRKLSSLDNRLVSPIIAQPLADLFGCIILSVANKGIDRVFPETFRSSHVESLRGELDAEKSQQCFDSANALFHRCLVSCIMNSRPTIRERALFIYGTQIADVGKKLSPTRCTKAGILSIPARSLFDTMWQLFHSDFEGVGGRLWPIIFVEVLTSCCLPGSGKAANTTAWMPRPRRPNWGGSSPGLPQKDINLFFRFISKFKSSYCEDKLCLKAIVGLAHGDPLLAQSLFESLLRSSWNHLGDHVAQSCLIRPIERLLSQPYHVEAFSCNDSKYISNSVQSLLSGCRKLNPQPVLDPDLLVSLASTYRAHHDVISILDHACQVLSPAHDLELLERVSSGIRVCMNELGERNLAFSQIQKWCKQPETTFALSLDIHGMVKEAIAAYGQLVDLAEGAGNGTTCKANDFETDLWEERWILLQKEMCQSHVVSDYAKSTENSLLLLQTAWKSQDWDQVSNLISSPSSIALCERGDPTLKINEILLAITKGKLSEVENLHAQTAQLCLQQWQLLPNLATGSYRHSDLLHAFHRLVEFRESGQIMVETTNHSSRRTLPDLQNLLSAWRHRLPNDHDSLSDWDDIISWRTHMFSSITSHFQWSENGSTLHDRPWTVIRMAKTARKQGLRDVANFSLSKITDTSMDVSDAFSKLREQILTFYNPDSDRERTGGLNLINSTNLSFFDARQKSELFRLKAQFLSSLGQRSKANQAYCHAVQVCPSYARAWVSWGGLCSSLGRFAEKQQLEQSQECASDKDNPDAKKVAQYLAQAMGCYLEAVNCDTDEWSRIHLPKCLWMLAKDGTTPGVLSQTLETRGAALPCWVWLPWCPQLLTCLYRNEGKAAKAILITLTKTYPQALYYPLRAFYLERRDVERSKGGPSGSHQGSVIHSEELMSSLRRAHASLWSSLEAILEELIVKFRTSYEEELLATMTALLDRAEIQMESSLHSTSDNSEDEEAVVASISKTLGRISTKFFRDAVPSDAAQSKRDERARKIVMFKRKYKSLFESDFLSLATKNNEEEVTKDEVKKKVDLNDFLGRLWKWKRMLEEQVAATPQSLSLIESSPSLALYSTEAPDLWPMSCDPKAGMALFETERTREDKPNPSSASTAAVAARTAAITAALAVASFAASEGYGGEYGGGSSSIEIPGQYVPNIVSAIDSKPSPELHAKLIQFEPLVEVVRRNDQLIRRIGMIGSDGRRYHFLLQFAIPYWTRTDERTVQICYLFDKILRRDPTSARNFLSIQPSPVIPIAQRLRMTAESVHRLSLDDVFRNRCKEAGCEPNAVTIYSQSRVKKILESKSTVELSTEEKKQLVVSTNLEVFREICENKVDRTMLLGHIQGNLTSAEALFHFRRTFASQLAINSLMQHVFSVVVRNPVRVVINQMNGQVFSPEFRLSYNNQGFLESQKVPFRMTPNMKEMVGAIMIEGRFIPSMAMTATAVKGSMEDIDAILRLLVRDDIISWYTSKSMAKSDSKTQELEKQLSDRVSKNVALIQSKISECTLKKQATHGLETLQEKPINQRLRELLEEASSFEKLSTMESSFQPWL